MYDFPSYGFPRTEAFVIQEEFHHVRAYFINGGTTLTSEEEDVIEALLAIGFFPGHSFGISATTSIRRTSSNRKYDF